MKKQLIILLLLTGLCFSQTDTFKLNLNPFPKKSQVAKYAYAGSIMLLLAHHSTIDAWIWEKGNKPIPSFIKKDYWYLGGTAICVTLLTMASYSYDDTFWGYTKTSVGSLLIGSVIWDLLFGTLLYNDAFYPFPNWYGGYGFRNKTERISFDLARLGLGIYLLVE